jgi:hypothetical protein
MFGGELSPRHVPFFVAEVGAVEFGVGVEREGIQGLQGSFDIELRPVDDAAAEPSGKCNDY